MAAQIVEKALEELKTYMVLLDLGNVIINTLLLFLFLLIFVTLFFSSIYYALVPALFYFIYALISSYRLNQYAKVEGKVPELNEQLRTVADNVNRMNPIVDSLKQDVVRNMSKVRTSYFIDYGNIATRISLVTIFAIVVVILAFMNVNFDFKFGEIKPLELLGVREAGQEIVNLNLSYLEGNLSDILGQESVAKLGREELRLEINPLESDADVNDINQIRQEDFNAPIFPKEIYTSYDVAYNERIAKENQKVVKSYFEQISG